MVWCVSLPCAPLPPSKFRPITRRAPALTAASSHSRRLRRQPPSVPLAWGQVRHFEGEWLSAQPWLVSAAFPTAAQAPPSPPHQHVHRLIFVFGLHRIHLFGPAVRCRLCAAGSQKGEGRDANPWLCPGNGGFFALHPIITISQSLTYGSYGSIPPLPPEPIPTGLSQLYSLTCLTLGVLQAVSTSCAGTFRCPSWGGSHQVGPAIAEDLHREKAFFMDDIWSHNISLFQTSNRESPKPAPV